MVQSPLTRLSQLAVKATDFLVRAGSKPALEGKGLPYNGVEGDGGARMFSEVIRGGPRGAGGA